MALPVANNNNAQPITQNGNYCQIQVPGYIPPEITGASGGSSPQFSAASYHIQAGSTGAGTTVTFQGQGADGVFRALASPAPITLTNGTVYNSTLTGSFGALRLAVSSVTGNGIAYAQLTGVPTVTGGIGQTVTSTLQFQSGQIVTQLYLDPVGGDLIVKSINGPNAGKTVNLTFGKWA
jgi:hypothetical protein